MPLLLKDTTRSESFTDRAGLLCTMPISQHTDAYAEKICSLTIYNGDIHTQKPPTQLDPQRTRAVIKPHLLRFARISSSCIGLMLPCAKARAASRDMCLHISFLVRSGKQRPGRISSLRVYMHTMLMRNLSRCLPGPVEPHNKHGTNDPSTGWETSCTRHPVPSRHLLTQPASH